MYKRNSLAVSISMVFSVIFLGVILSSFSPAPTPPQGCIQIDPASCKGDFSNAVLNLDIYKGEIWYYYYDGNNYHWSKNPPGYGQMSIFSPPTQKTLNMGTGGSSGDNTVSGYEINYGFWSRDSYREYTWREMFIWKNHREPTPQELANLTCEQVKQWFNERHTVNRPWPIPNDPPRNVNCNYVSFKPYCMDLTSEIYQFSGFVQFPNGIKCKVKNYSILRTEYSRQQNNTFKLKIVKPCAACQ